jgi:hypothetical protein
VLCRFVGFEPFTALSIYSPFQNPVNPPILFLGWLNKVIALLQIGASPGVSCVVLERSIRQAVTTHTFRRRWFLNDLLRGCSNGLTLTPTQES